jgi:hypothetical protein
VDREHHGRPEPVPLRLRRAAIRLGVAVVHGQ